MPRHKPLYHALFKRTKLSLFSRFTVIISGLLTTTLSVSVLAPIQAQTQTQTQAQAQAQTPIQAPIQTQTIGIRYNPPNRGAPGTASTSDAGSRSCGLMVFGPAQSHWGETLQPHPSFWLYPSNPGTVAVELTVEETAEVVHRDTFEVTQGQMITSYTLPETATALNINDAYRWNFTLDCPGDPDPSANGIIVRREDTLQEETDSQETDPQEPALEEPVLEEASESPESSDPLTQARQLAADGFWFDAINTLNQLRLVEVSTAATQDWRTLLEQGGWREILGDRFEQIVTASFSSAGSSNTDLSIESSPQPEPASEPTSEPAPEVNP